MLRRAGVPVLAAAVVIAAIAWPRFQAHHRDPIGFVEFGQQYFKQVRMPPGARAESPFGYDGQYFWLMALSPLLGHSSVDGLQAVGQQYRAQRIAYPTIASALALHRPALIPWSLLGLNVLVLLAATYLAAKWAKRNGRSPWWGLALGLTPGLVLATMRDLSDPLAVTALVGGLIAWRLDRRLAAALLLCLAVLTRETMLIGVAAVALDAALRWRRTADPGERRDLLQRSWPVLVAPAACFLVWQAYATVRFGAPPVASTGQSTDVAGLVGKGQFDLPFAGSGRLVERALEEPSLHERVWELAYVVLIVAGVAVAVRAAFRSPRAMSLAGALFGLAALVQVSGDRFGYTRASAPLFACLLLVGLERDRWALGVAGATAALVVALPAG